MKCRHLVIGLAMLAGAAAPAAAQVTLEFRNGLVNLSAREATVRTILSEWSRLGGTKIVNGDRVTGAPMSIELTGVTERQALDILLRGASGYMVATRQTPGSGASKFDRIMILPTSTAPRTAQSFVPPPAAPATFRQPPPPPDDPPDDADAERATIVINGRGTARQPAVVFTDRPTAPQLQPQPQPRAVEVDTEADTAPPATTANPFGIQPGSVRPGVITPAPQPQNPNGTQRAK